IMDQITTYLHDQWPAAVVAIALGLLAWWANELVGRPLRDFIRDRNEALDVLQQHGATLFGMEDRYLVDARAAIDGVAAKMNRYAQSGPNIVRLWAWWWRYDLNMAGRALNGLRVGYGPADEARQRKQRDFVRFCLRATGQMTPERQR